MLFTQIPDLADERGNTPLVAASANTAEASVKQRKACVRMLLDAGADATKAFNTGAHESVLQMLGAAAGASIDGASVAGTVLTVSGSDLGHGVRVQARGSTTDRWRSLDPLDADPTSASFTLPPPLVSAPDLDVIVVASGTHQGISLSNPRDPNDTGTARDSGPIVIDRVPRRTIFSVLPKVFSGQHVGHPAVRVERTARLEIHTDEPRVVHADGEYLGTTPLVLQTQPGALQVVRPPD